MLETYELESDYVVAETVVDVQRIEAKTATLNKAILTNLMST